MVSFARLVASLVSTGLLAAAAPHERRLCIVHPPALPATPTNAVLSGEGLELGISPSAGNYAVLEKTGFTSGFQFLAGKPSPFGAYDGCLEYYLTTSGTAVAGFASVLKWYLPDILTDALPTSVITNWVASYGSDLALKGDPASPLFWACSADDVTATTTTKILLLLLRYSPIDAFPATTAEGGKIYPATCVPTDILIHALPPS